MTFDAWWNSLTTEEQNRMDHDGAETAWELGQLEAAQTILKMWYAPWCVTQMPFIDSLKAYVEELT